ncbi:hypothetical protein Oweho_1888 [Owenweeksia hongkongensis DSM 17368]|uniref:Uncharacterized protein n=1 Tax=Owenweeksia hongkongensis (strain DSM 17368 / CIP 108786 / JCM 12287 / NRRL B-23963 / UST20020801) TaxID=926562 RepID=G8R1U1_OWEHD|nr:hypothetical protein [Owenweeksia hongkongensis]AEV32867.1 hypothetical protein Oweho_1888 [Owenweeksia hongkongensis DSM 17368]
MSSIDKIPNSSEGDADEVEMNPPSSKVEGMLEQFEMFAMQQKGAKNSFDTSKFTPQQTDKLLDILATNEDNAYKFHNKRLDTVEKIQLKAIESSTINQKTIRYGLVGIIIAVPIITILILFFKENYFIPWLTFMTGLAGGFGLSKVSKHISKGSDPENILPASDSEEG